MSDDERDPGVAIRTVPTAAERLIAVCGKCGKKLGGGFGSGSKKSLVKALRVGVADTKGKRRRVRIVETRCMDLCPKGAVVVVDSDSPNEFLVVAKATPVSVVAARLGLRESD